MMFEEILLDQQEIVKELLKGKLIERDIGKERVLKYLKYPNIVAILGVRRSGKTSYSLKCFENKNFFYINFDDERLYGLEVKELNELLKISMKIKDYEYLILDEIQNIKGWELFVNRLRNTKKLIITGSNSNLLSSELSTYLTGRHIDIHIMPFSFKEHLRIKNFELNNNLLYSTRHKAMLIREIEEYLKLGGFPEIHKFGPEIIKYLLEDIISKDIIRRENIKKIKDFEKFTFQLFSNFTHKISIKKLSGIMKINHITINNWLKLLENSFVMYTLNKFSFKSKEIVLSRPKIYFVDNGLININAFRFSENKGKLMENTVFTELLRKKYNNSNLEIYYYEDNINNYEVDFLIKEETEIKELIQVTYASSFEEILDREIRALLHAKEDLKLKDDVPLTVITWDYEDEKEIEWWKKRGKIKFIPLWKFLIQ